METFMYKAWRHAKELYHGVIYNFCSLAIRVMVKSANNQADN
jgi:hypothetical protein